MVKQNKYQTQERFIALDIGTEVAKALVCLPREDEIEVTAVARKRQQRGNMSEGAISDLEGVGETLKRAVRYAGESADGSEPTQVIANISGNLVRGIKSSIEYVRPHPDDPVTDNEVKNLFHHLRWKTKERVRKQLTKELNNPQLDVGLVHASLSSLMIDGQTVEKLTGFKGRKITAVMFGSYAPMTQIEAIKSLVEKLGKQVIGIFAQSYPVARAMSIRDQSQNAIVIDVGGGTTDVSVVRNGIIEGSKSFNIAGRAFTERLAISQEMDWHRAEEIKLAYSEEALDEQAQGSIGELFARDARVWLSGIKNSLSKFQDIEALPNKIYLCGGGSQLDELTEALDTGWWNSLPLSEKPKVHNLQPEDIELIVDRTGKLLDTQDTAPMCLAAMHFEEKEPRLLKSFDNRY